MLKDMLKKVFKYYSAVKLNKINMKKNKGNQKPNTFKIFFKPI